MSKDGGPAFPGVIRHDGVPQDVAMGLTKLDYFAAAALRGWMGSNDIRPHDSNIPSLASDCFNIAEAMLAESERRSKLNV